MAGDEEDKVKKEAAIQAYMRSVKRKESGGDPNAKSKTSSAKGLYQFTDATWKDIEKKLGRKLNINNSRDQEVAMRKFTDMNVAVLEKNGIEVTPGNLYMTHFLGNNGGVKFLKNLQENPNELASKYVDKAAVNANQGLFFKDGKPITAAELYNKATENIQVSQPQQVQPNIPQSNIPQPTQEEVAQQEQPNKRLSKPIPNYENVIKQLNPVEEKRTALDLSGNLDFLSQDANLLFNEDNVDNTSAEQNDQMNPEDYLNVQEDGGKQKTLSKIGKTSDILNEFNAGGKHEENKFGGIPQGVGQNGKLNTVEEGETKYNDYVFSNNLKINEDDVKNLFLSEDLTDMTFADASKYINKILEDNPSDKIIKKTVLKQLDSLVLGNEKARIAKEQLDVNLGLAPEENKMFFGGMMDGASGGGGGGMMGMLGGMMGGSGGSSQNIFVTNPDLAKDKEEEQNQMFLGGFGNSFNMQSPATTDNYFSSRPEDLTDNPQTNNIQATETPSMATPGINNTQQSSSPNKYLSALGEGFSAGRMTGTGYSGYLEEKYKYDPKSRGTEQGIEGMKDMVEKLPVIGSFAKVFRGIENGVKQMGVAFGGEKGGDAASGVMDPFTQQVNVFKSKDATAGEKIVSLVNPAASGMMARKSIDRAKSRFHNRESIKYNKQFRDNDFEDGGQMKNKNIYRDGKKLNFWPGSEDYSSSEYDRPGYYVDAPDNTSIYPQNQYPILEDNTVEPKEKMYKAKGINPMQYASIFGSGLNYLEDRKKKPEVERLQRLGDKFRANYVDESTLQRIADQELNNNINAFSQMGGSQGAIRNAIIAAGLNKNKALSDAYMNAENINRDVDNKGQIFDLDVNKSNIVQDNQEKDINARNRARVEDQKRLSRNQLFANISALGKEKTLDNRLQNLTGYNSQAQYTAGEDRESRMKMLMEYMKQLFPDQDNNKSAGGFLDSISNTLDDYHQRKQMRDTINKI